VLQVLLLLLQGVEAGEATLVAVDLLLQLCDPAGEIGRVYGKTGDVGAVVIEREQPLKVVDHSVGSTCSRMQRRSMGLCFGHGQPSGHGWRGVSSSGWWRSRSSGGGAVVVVMPGAEFLIRTCLRFWCALGQELAGP
jgi:hypothetical protein